MTGPGNFGVEFWYITDKKKVWKPVLKGANPIRGANPHGAGYSLNVIPGKEIHTVSEYAKRLGEADAGYMANGGTIGIALGSKENR